MKKETTPVKASNYFVCQCAPDKEMTGDETREHLKTVHKLEPPRQGTKKMILHLDAEDAFYSTFEWKFGDLIVHQYCSNPRTKRTAFL